MKSTGIFGGRDRCIPGNFRVQCEGVSIQDAPGITAAPVVAGSGRAVHSEDNLVLAWLAPEWEDSQPSLVPE